MGGLLVTCAWSKRQRVPRLVFGERDTDRERERESARERESPPGHPTDPSSGAEGGGGYLRLFRVPARGPGADALHEPGRLEECERRLRARPPLLQGERILVEVMTSDRNLEASREGSK